MEACTRFKIRVAIGIQFFLSVLGRAYVCVCIQSRKTMKWNKYQKRNAIPLKYLHLQNLICIFDSRPHFARFPTFFQRNPILKSRFLWTRLTLWAVLSTRSNIKINGKLHTFDVFVILYGTFHCSIYIGNPAVLRYWHRIEGIPFRSGSNTVFVGIVLELEHFTRTTPNNSDFLWSSLHNNSLFMRREFRQVRSYEENVYRQTRMKCTVPFNDAKFKQSTMITNIKCVNNIRQYAAYEP